MRFSEPLKALKEPLFAKLYLAQAISLGDAFTWMGIALLAFELGNSESRLLSFYRFFLMRSGRIVPQEP